MEPTWRGRIGSTILGAVFGALVGWALSLTQGTSPQRWPFILTGALIVGALALILWEKALAPRFKNDAPTARERKIIRVYGKVLRKGQTALQNLNAGNLITVDAVTKWEQWGERRIARSVGDDLAGLFATAETSVAPNQNVPKALPVDIERIWKRVDAKLRWLRYQIKNGPHK